MATGTQAIRRRIKSVESTKKITKAMTLVATAKLRKSRNIMEERRDYYRLIRHSVAKVLNGMEEESKYTSLSKSDKELYIIISSDLGLCGGYNSNALKLAVSKIRERDEVYVVGGKAAHYFKVRSKVINKEYMSLSSSQNIGYINRLINEVLKKYISGEVNKIHVVYTEFINNLTFTPTISTLLPIEKDEFEADGEYSYTIFEPNKEVVLDQLVPMYMQSVFTGMLFESITSENAARRASMDTATDNASELIDSLLLKYNQARQAAITQEISEIVAGSRV